MSDRRHEPSGLAWRLGLIGAAVSAVVLIAIALLDHREGPAQVEPPQAPTELIGPRPLDPGDPMAGGLTDPNLSVSLPKGGWLQVAGPDGNLAQQYRFSHLDPNPPDLPANWVQMRDPDVELFMAGGRLITLSGREADAFAPRRALEEGRLIGDVVIRMFEAAERGYADPSVDAPALTIHTDAALFDNLSGRIACEGQLELTTATEHMVGHGLSVLLNDRDNRIEYLEIKELDFLLLKDAAVQTASRTRPSPSSPARRRIVAVSSETTAPDPPPFYRVTLHDSVRIEQAPAADVPQAHPRLVTADLLHVVFSFASDALTNRSGASRPPESVPMSAPMSVPMLVAASAMGVPPPPLAPQETLITCSGPLTMVPLEPDEPRPARTQDTLLELVGSPVRVLAPEQGLTTTCDRITWRSDQARFDLTSSPPHRVRINTEDLSLQSAHVWAEPDAGRGGIIGAGEAALNNTPTGVDEAASTARTPDGAMDDLTTIHWEDGVDLAFEPGGAEQRGLRSITFRSDVAVRSPEGQIDADTLDMRFEPGSDGRAVPDRMIAKGGVRAASDEQVLWTDELLATLEPTGDADEQSEASVEVREFLATGDVQVRLADGARAWADQLRGDAAQESVELAGDDVTIARDEVVIQRGTHMRIERTLGTADWTGPGRAVLLATPLNLPEDRRIHRPALPETLGQADSEITWAEAVHIEFDPAASTQDAAMQSIAFSGSVSVESPDGTISAESLTMEFDRDDQGRATPEQLTCTNRVRAHSDGQTLWADRLEATLEPAADEFTSGGPAGSVTLRTFEATGDVQVLMDDGSRAFADALTGDAAQEVVRLTGSDVLIARQDVLIDRGHDLTINRLAGTADWAGRGRSRMLAAPLQLSADVRIPPPRIVGRAGDPAVTMRTTWTESLHYDSRFGDGAGAMDLRGNVDCVVDRSADQRSSLQGDSVRLEFARLDEASTEEPVDDSPFASGSRALHTLIAKGNARLESRQWQTAARAVLPRVFYVGAQHITWNDLYTEAEVTGDGDIVIREPDWSGRSGGERGPFSGPGTSRFVWSERLDLIHEADDRFRLTMSGDVEGLWKSSVDDRDIATLTAEEVRVLTRRSETVSDAPLQLGGDMEVDRLRAIGRVYLSTPTRRADCHMLEYNTRTRIAELVARAGRTVSVLTEGARMPVQATRMTWNMDPAIDTITLEHPRGSGGAP
ncbi:MAG: hypothetical protein QF733_06900 [Phycisphaerales bacterium]|jgi:hypothetical protein|nr:hypothetical protein [Phycisphaerales bacterium]